jgi:hypothetical protein
MSKSGKAALILVLTAALKFWYPDFPYLGQLIQAPVKISAAHVIKKS